MEQLGYIAAIASAASWAFATVMFDRIGKSINYAGITFLKGVFSIVMMVCLVIWSGGLTECNFADFLVLALSGIIGIAVGDTLFFRSLQDLGAKMQVLFFMLGQIVTMLLSFLLLGDVLSITEYLGALVLLSGVIVVIWGKQEDRPNKTRGIIGGLISMLCFSISSIMVKIAIGDIDIVTATFYRMVFGTASIMFVGLTSNKLISWVRPLRDIRLLMMFILNVFVLTVGGFMLSTLAIKNISVSIASVLSTTEPIFVLLFAFLINKEKAKPKEILGAAVTICGLLIMILYG
ncbi:MAG: DMT family transporter [Bacteroidaceae bacterium]|nr:DMT family transporter [Bacteroidaceae bacterium]